MAEQRKKQASVCVKNGANSGGIELFPASEWGGPETLFRIRHNRKWIDGTHGAMRFFTHSEVGTYISDCIFGTELCAENNAKRPKNFHYKMRVSVPNGRDIYSRDVTTISTEHPMRGFDGRWYVGAHLLGRGVVMIPCDEVIVK